MERFTGYRANDGKAFETAYDCMKYEGMDLPAMWGADGRRVTNDDMAMLLYFPTCESMVNYLEHLCELANGYPHSTKVTENSIGFWAFDGLRERMVQIPRGAEVCLIKAMRNFSDTDFCLMEDANG